MGLPAAPWMACRWKSTQSPGCSAYATGAMTCSNSAGTASSSCSSAKVVTRSSASSGASEGGSPSAAAASCRQVGPSTATAHASCSVPPSWCGAQAWEPASTRRLTAAGMGSSAVHTLSMRGPAPGSEKGGAARSRCQGVRSLAPASFAKTSSASNATRAALRVAVPGRGCSIAAASGAAGEWRRTARRPGDAPLAPCSVNCRNWGPPSPAAPPPTTTPRRPPSRSSDTACCASCSQRPLRPARTATTPSASSSRCTAAVGSSRGGPSPRGSTTRLAGGGGVGYRRRSSLGKPLAGACRGTYSGPARTRQTRPWPLGRHPPCCADTTTLVRMLARYSASLPRTGLIVPRRPLLQGAVCVCGDCGGGGGGGGALRRGQPGPAGSAASARGARRMARWTSAWRAPCGGGAWGCRRRRGWPAGGRARSRPAAARTPRAP
mmetsp:Transcript_29862/g.74920  ORF Transcript_29862/g.74920 Transcript_29862/m.74920 type:complete len:436 (+) Transcript_29862:133-1440(+)